ncbi:MAG: protein kinase domain-containing protein, partial [Gemmataceae bacterium]
RDLKPANLMVDRAGHCWLIDFGLAGDIDEESAGPVPAGRARGPVTVSGVMGTPPYMAPEQWEGRADRRTDVYGLGVTMYELLTLRGAFEGGAGDMKRRVQTETPPRPREVAPNVHPDLEAICLKAMSKDISRRYETAREFVADVRRWLASEPTRARPPWPPRRAWLWARREPWRAAMTALLVLLLIGGGARAYAAEYERARQREAEANLLRMQQIRLGARALGWSKIALDAGEAAAARSGATPELRSHVAAAQLGLDGEVIKSTAGGASSLAFDGAGKRLLRGGREKEPSHLYDVATDRTTTHEQAGPGPVAFLADGTPAQLVMGGWPVRLVDLPKNRVVRELTPPEKERRPVRDLALSADGAVAATVQGESEGGRLIHVWDLKTGKVIHSLERPTVAALAFSPDGAELAVGQDDGTITVWSEKGAKSATLSAGRLSVYGLAFGRDPHRARTGREWLLASGDAGGSVTVWDLSAGQVRTRCYGAHHQVYSLAFSPDGMTLASGGRGPVKLWDLATGRLVLDLRSAPDYATALAFAPGGGTLAASSRAEVHMAPSHFVWSLAKRRPMLDLRGLTAQVARARFSRDGKRLAALAQNWEVGVWDLDTGDLLHVLAAPAGILTDNAGIDFSPDGKELAFCAGTQARRWDVASGRETGRWAMPPGMVDRLLHEEKTGALIACRVETRDGKRFPLRNAPPDVHPRVVRFYELKGKGERELVGKYESFQRHVFDQEASTEGTCFVLQGINGKPGETRTIKSFSPRGKELWSINVPDRIPDFKLDPSGRFVCLSTGVDRSMNVVSAATGQIVGTVPMIVWGLGLAAERWVVPATVTGGGCSGFDLYERGGRAPVLAVGIDRPAHAGASVFSRAGTHIALCNEDGSVTVCDLPAVQRKLSAIGLGW